MVWLAKEIVKQIGHSIIDKYCIILYATYKNVCIMYDDDDTLN